MKFITLFILLGPLLACTTFQPERLDYSSIELSSKKTSLQYAVYTPPDWSLGERLPLILFLHGGGGSHKSFERYRADEFLDAEVRAGRVARAVILLPNGDNGFWENWADGSRLYRDWVLEDLIPEVQGDYQTLPCPEFCHLAGISMGGYGVLRFAVFAPEQFSSVSAISAPIFNREQADNFQPSLLVRLLIPFKRIFGEKFSAEFIRSNPYNAFTTDKNLRRFRLQLIRGSIESQHIIDSNERFHERLRQADFTHEYWVYNGGHKWRDWIPNLGRVINFLTSNDVESGQ